MNYTSDYGGSSSSMNSSWGSSGPGVAKAASFADLVSGRCTLEDVMQEFRRNGSDAPFNPDDEDRRSAVPLTTYPTYMRQCSWPAPDRSPMERLPRQRPYTVYTDTVLDTTGFDNVPGSNIVELTEEQRRVLSTLPDTAVVLLLREMQRGKKKQTEICRFCRNNGERESYYRSHSLRDAEGAVSCPVLRAFVCRRCGATGDHAHTIKYCPLATSEERLKSAAMMRSVRLASGRRRGFAATPLQPDDVTRAPPAPLGPLWAALEQKLLR